MATGFRGTTKGLSHTQGVCGPLEENVRHGQEKANRRSIKVWKDRPVAGSSRMATPA